MKDSPQQEEQETFFFNFRNKAIADVKLTRCLEGVKGTQSGRGCSLK